MVSEAEIARENVGEDPGERRRKAILGLLALFAIVALIVWWLLAQLVPVPDVTGLDQAEAVARLQAAGFRVGEIVNVDATDDQKPGTVVGQTPSAGERLPKDSTIGLSLAGTFGSDSDRQDAVSSGSGLIDQGYLDLPEEGRDTDNVGLAPESPPVNSGPQVPLVLDKTESSAKSVLAASGYGISFKRAASTTGVAAGLVMRQDPPPEAYEPRGTVVTVWVSTGSPR